MAMQLELAALTSSPLSLIILNCSLYVISESEMKDLFQYMLKDPLALDLRLRSPPSVWL